MMRTIAKKMDNEKVIERLIGYRNYLCRGNPIWDVDECREVFDRAIAAMQCVAALEKAWFRNKGENDDA